MNISLICNSHITQPLRHKYFFFFFLLIVSNLVWHLVYKNVRKYWKFPTTVSLNQGFVLSSNDFYIQHSKLRDIFNLQIMSNKENKYLAFLLDKQINKTIVCQLVDLWIIIRLCGNFTYYVYKKHIHTISDISCKSKRFIQNYINSSKNVFCITTLHTNPNINSSFHMPHWCVKYKTLLSLVFGIFIVACCKYRSWTQMQWGKQMCLFSILNISSNCLSKSGLHCCAQQRRANLNPIVSVQALISRWSNWLQVHSECSWLIIECGISVAVFSKQHT